MEPPYKPLEVGQRWEDNFDEVFIRARANDSISKDDFLNLDKFKKDFELFDY